MNGKENVTIEEYLYEYRNNQGTTSLIHLLLGAESFLRN